VLHRAVGRGDEEVLEVQVEAVVEAETVVMEGRDIS